MEKLIAIILQEIEEYVNRYNTNELYGAFFKKLICKEELENEIDYNCGETRWCIIFKNYDYVLKIPRFSNTATDYCAIELENYNQAKKIHIEQIVLPIEKIAVLGKFKLPIYQQPKYTSSWGDTDKQFLDDLEKHIHKTITNTKASGIIRYNINRMYDAMGIEYVFIARIMELYGKQFLRRFVKWTNKQSVNDLHRGNYGFKNKKPVLIDYAGYFG